MRDAYTVAPESTAERVRGHVAPPLGAGASGTPFVIFFASAEIAALARDAGFKDA